MKFDIKYPDRQPWISDSHTGTATFISIAGSLTPIRTWARYQNRFWLWVTRESNWRPTGTKMTVAGFQVCFSIEKQTWISNC